MARSIEGSSMIRYGAMICIMLCMVSYGASNQEVFLRGNKAYAESAYTDALVCYEQIPHKGSAVWYNMGNCYYQLERPVDACVCWQRAQRHASYQDYCALTTNITGLEDDQEKAAQSAYAAWVFWIRAHTQSYSLLIIQLIAIAIWFALCIALYTRVHLIVSFSLLILSIVFVCLSIDMQKERYRAYAVTKEDALLYVGPNSSYHQQGIIKPARSVVIIDERDGWYKINYKELAGWVQADTLVKV